MTRVNDDAGNAEPELTRQREATLKIRRWWTAAGRRAGIRFGRSFARLVAGDPVVTFAADATGAEAGAAGSGKSVVVTRAASGGRAAPAPSVRDASATPAPRR